MRPIRNCKYLRDSYHLEGVHSQPSLLQAYGLFITLWKYLFFLSFSIQPSIQTLLSFLLPGHGRLCSRIEEVLDLPLIQQQAENGALDIGQLSQFVVEMMASMCAPCRDKDVRNLKQITEIIPLLKWATVWLALHWPGFILFLDPVISSAH